MAEILTHEFDGAFSITLNCDTPADEVVQSAGHEPNGYFWEGVAQVLLATEAQNYAPRIGFDSEGSMFCATSDEVDALNTLTRLMTPVVNDPDRVLEVLRTAAQMGFEFDD